MARLHEAGPEAATLGSPDARNDTGLLVVAVLAALCCLPMILPAKSTPATTVENQILTVALWGVFLVGLALFAGHAQAGSDHRSGERSDASRSGRAGLRSLIAWGLSPSGRWLACCGAGLVACLAMLLVPRLATTGASLAVALIVCVTVATLRPEARTAAWDGLMIGLAGVGLISAAMAVVQIHWPGWAGSDWLPQAAQGRATGALRQPNHLSTLLMWASLAWIWCAHRSRPWLQSRGAARAGSAHLADGANPSPAADRPGEHAVAAVVFWGGLTLLLYGMVLSASRTGLLGVLLMGSWGVFGRRLPAPLRKPLVLAPLLYALGWGLMKALEGMQGAAGSGMHLPPPGGDISSSRFGIWANTWVLIRENPWVGVGWGEFNFAWTLTPFPGRPVAFFDHTHNLFLQLAVELGLPVALAATTWVLWWAWRACAGSRQALARGDASANWALLMLVLVGLHSLLEYPLWYTYFLLPSALALGVCAPGGQGLSRAEARPTALNPAAQARGTVPDAKPMHPVILVAGLLVVAASLAAMWEFRVIRSIYAPAPGAAPLAERIERGQRGWFFAHHAHYAAATVDSLHARARDALPAIALASHHLLDTRLMMAWAQALADSGELDRARFLVERLREFNNPNAQEFLGECDGDPEPLPFQCTAPERSYRYTDFR